MTKMFLIGRLYRDAGGHVQGLLTAYTGIPYTAYAGIPDVSAVWRAMPPGSSFLKSLTARERAESYHLAQWCPNPISTHGDCR